MGQFDLSKLYPLNPFEKQMKNVFIAFRNEISPNEIIEDVTKMMNFTRTYFNALSLERQKESGICQ